MRPMNLDEVEQLGVLMGRPRPTSVLHDDSGGGEEDGVRCVEELRCVDVEGEMSRRVVGKMGLIFF